MGKSDLREAGPQDLALVSLRYKRIEVLQETGDKKTGCTIGNEQAAGFASFKLTDGWQVSSINSTLRTLRRVLRSAVEWGEMPKAPKIKFLSGENHRERVITLTEEQKYLENAAPLLHDVATVLLDTGMRPDECHRLVWDN